MASFQTKFTLKNKHVIWEESPKYQGSAFVLRGFLREARNDARVIKMKIRIVATTRSVIGSMLHRACRVPHGAPPLSPVLLLPIFYPYGIKPT